MTDASDTARMAQRLPEDALAQCFAGLPVETFRDVRGAVIDACIDEVDRLLDNTRDETNLRHLRRLS